MLFIILIIVYMTGKWDILEILVLFVANFLANMFVMAAIGNYSQSKNIIWSWYHISATTVFTMIWVYWYIDQWIGQYLVFQISFILAVIKAAVYYNFSKELRFLNEYILIAINILLFIIFYKYFSPDIPSIFQALWFIIITTGLISIHDNIRYILSVIWTILLLIWSFLISFLSYKAWNIDWIALWFLLLTSTTFIYYMKLLPSYINTIQKK